MNSTNGVINPQCWEMGEQVQNKGRIMSYKSKMKASAPNVIGRTASHEARPAGVAEFLVFEPERMDAEGTAAAVESVELALAFPETTTAESGRTDA